MKGLVERVVGRRGAAEETVTYDESKVLAADRDGENRRALAARVDVKPEVLYYLAADQLPSVRCEIAAHEKTPRPADRPPAQALADDVPSSPPPHAERLKEALANLEVSA